MDLSKLWPYKWGDEAYNYLVSGIRAAVTAFHNGKVVACLQGCSFALMVWILSRSKKVDLRARGLSPRFLNYKYGTRRTLASLSLSSTFVPSVSQIEEWLLDPIPVGPTQWFQLILQVEGEVLVNRFDYVRSDRPELKEKCEEMKISSDCGDMEKKILLLTQKLETIVELSSGVHEASASSQMGLCIETMTVKRDGIYFVHTTSQVILERSRDYWGFDVLTLEDRNVIDAFLQIPISKSAVLWSTLEFELLALDLHDLLFGKHLIDRTIHAWLVCMKQRSNITIWQGKEVT